MYPAFLYRDFYNSGLNNELATPWRGPTIIRRTSQDHAMA